MSSKRDGTPHALAHNVEHNRVLHERTLILTLVTTDHPYVPRDERYEVRDLGEGLHQMIAYYEFAEDPDVPELMNYALVDGEGFDLSETTFFLGRESLVASEKPGMAQWREALFSRMSRNARRATAYFNLPADRVIEVGTQINL